MSQFREKPLGFNNLEYTVTIKSQESKEKIQLLFEHATTHGTATNALLEGLNPINKLQIIGPATN